MLKSEKSTALMPESAGFVESCYNTKNYINTLIIYDFDD